MHVVVFEFFFLSFFKNNLKHNDDLFDILQRNHFHLFLLHHICFIECTHQLSIRIFKNGVESSRDRIEIEASIDQNRVVLTVRNALKSKK